MDVVTLLVLLGAVVFIVVVAWLSPARADRAGDLRGRIQRACQEARTIVDLTTPVDNDSSLPDTVTLSEVTRRIQHLNGQLRELVSADLPHRISESIEDVHRVAGSLAAALDAERSLRLSNPKQLEAHRARSVERIAERSYELNAAAEDLQWLVEANDG